jgi:hypothetical protein
MTSCSASIAPAQGRWLVPDPAGLAAVDLTNPQTWNRYAYVANNPLSRIDPFGLFMSTAPPPPEPPSGCGEDAGLPDWTCLAFEGWPGWGTGQSFWCMMMGGCPGGSGGSGGGGGSATVPPSENTPFRPVLRYHNNCCDMAAAARAYANWSTLDAAANGNWDDGSLLAAVGVRESGFRYINENDGAGVGVGVFQITVSPTSGVTAAQAGNLTWAANYAEGGYLSDSRNPNILWFQKSGSAEHLTKDL